MQPKNPKLEIKNETLDPTTLSSDTPILQAHELMRDMLALPASPETYGIITSACSGNDKRSWCVAQADFRVFLVAYAELLRIHRNQLKAEEKWEELLDFDERFPDIVRHVCHGDLSMEEAAQASTVKYFDSQEEFQAFEANRQAQREQKLSQVQKERPRAKRYPCVGYANIFTTDENGVLHDAILKQTAHIMEDILDLLMDIPESAVVSSAVHVSVETGECETATTVQGHRASILVCLLEILSTWRDQIKHIGDIEALEYVDILFPNLVQYLCDDVDLDQALAQSISSVSGAPVDEPAPRNRAERRRLQRKKGKRLK